MAMQLAVRVERSDPPTTAQAAAAAATATIALLDDERSGPGGPWHEAVERWNRIQIRKVVRRGRGSAWLRAQEVEGVTVTVDGVEARAFVPCPVDEVPRPVAKLQVQSSPLANPDRVDEAPTTDGLQVAVTPEVEMSWGKQAAQCAHAAQRAWLTAPAATARPWTAAGCPIVIVHPTRTLWERCVADATIRIRDAGYTEIPSGTLTAVAHWVGFG